MGMLFLVCVHIWTVIILFLSSTWIFNLFHRMAGPRFKDAFQEPSVYLALEPFFEVSTLRRGKPSEISLFWSTFSYLINIIFCWLIQKERYVVTYNPSKGKVYALLKDRAKSDDILKAAFHVRFIAFFWASGCDEKHFLHLWRELRIYFTLYYRLRCFCISCVYPMMLSPRLRSR